MHSVPTSQLSIPVYLPSTTSQGSPTAPSPPTSTQTLIPHGSPSIGDTAVHFWPSGQSWLRGSHWPLMPPSGGTMKPSEVEATGSVVIDTVVPLALSPVVLVGCGAVVAIGVSVVSEPSVSVAPASPPEMVLAAVVII